MLYVNRVHKLTLFGSKKSTSLIPFFTAHELPLTILSPQL